MGLKVTNNAFGTLNAGINSSATTIVLTAGQGARFPTLSAGDYFYATLIDTSNNLEIVKVTARSTDTMTVVRGQDNTTARAYSTNDRFELRPTAALFNEKANDNEVVHLAGTETISGSKTFSSGFTVENDVVLGRTSADNSFVLSAAAQSAGREGVFQSAGGGAISTAWRFRGRVLKQDTPAFSASFNISSPTSYTAGGRYLNFTTVNFNIGNHYDGTNKFTAPVAGRYLFMVDRAMNTYGNGQTIRHPSMSFNKNGSSLYQINTAVSTGTDLAGSDYAHFNQSMTAILDLAANDYIQVNFVYANDRGVLYEYATSYFQGYLLG